MEKHDKKIKTKENNIKDEAWSLRTELAMRAQISLQLYYM